MGLRTHHLVRVDDALIRADHVLDRVDARPELAAERFGLRCPGQDRRLEGGIDHLDEELVAHRRVGGRMLPGTPPEERSVIQDRITRHDALPAFPPDYDLPRKL